MEEVYSFAARVAERGVRQILIIPEEPEALLEYFEPHNCRPNLIGAATTSASLSGARP